jgi:23S rRNA U2552 (ribose-2'-O)-methylase RlmE/FtsJ
MTYYILPNIYPHINLNNIVIKIFSDIEESTIISKSLRIYLNDIKKLIDNCLIEWDIYKKYTNNYEYIHTIIPNTKISVCKLKPMSRSFYKMIELCNIFNLFENLDAPIKSFHLAEGPGGFIEAFVYLRNNSKDKYFGMTLQSDDINVPAWKKSYYFLQNNKNVIIENGITGTGDLMSKDNLLYCLKNYNNSMDFVTGDGGFDFSFDFNKQEQLCMNLIFAQICFALAIQKKGGTFILKIFDIFTQASLDLLYLLSNVYEKVYIIKPKTSRTANSEKYLVCKEFRLLDSNNLVIKLSKIYDYFDKNVFIGRYLNINLSYLYINKIEEYNAIFGQQQIENINSTLGLINNCKNDKIELHKKNNIQKCGQWCFKYNLPYNKNIQSLNIFISEYEDKQDKQDKELIL